MATAHVSDSPSACPKCCSAPLCPACGAACLFCHGKGALAAVCALCDAPVTGALVPCACSPGRGAEPGLLGRAAGRKVFHASCYFVA